MRFLKSFLVKSGMKGAMKMIKLRIYNPQEYLDTHRIPANGARKPDHLYVSDSFHTSFWHIMCPTLIYGEEAEKPPFRDAESIQLLKDSYGVVFADDGDLQSWNFSL